jgi:hypothetical protein
MTVLLDERLIELLSQDARQSGQALAEHLNVSSSTIRRRISKLVKRGCSEGSCTSTSVAGLVGVMNLPFLLQNEVLSEFLVFGQRSYLFSTSRFSSTSSA